MLGESDKLQLTHTGTHYCSFDKIIRRPTIRFIWDISKKPGALSLPAPSFCATQKFPMILLHFCYTFDSSLLTGPF